MKPIADADVIKVLQDIAKEKPRNLNPMIDETCVYTNERGRHCLVGEAFQRMGLPLPGVDDILNTRGVAEVVSQSGLSHRFRSGAVDVLRWAQEEADGGTRWGPAIRRVLADWATRD